MIGEETADKTDLVADKEPETQTEEARPNHEASIEPSEFITGERKRQGERGGNQHHSRDGSSAENQQVKNRPSRITNRAQHQQSHSGGTCQAVNDADDQRAQRVKKTQTPRRSKQPIRRGKTIAMVIRGRGVGVPVKVRVGLVLVEMGMFPGYAWMGRGEFFADPFHRAGEVQHAEQNQHETHGEFHGQSGPRRNCQAK